ncbi:hypothetical protein PR048_023222 [Dryococelus australis]|uniref:Reverse transcriptase domain-containing protein n=1 Tax=Dryococelus australis TaxID=614101 RepID=A0ABQ9GTG6_9NEOP|nr:hypothetical protein PR048_023222 [Dryococelus australis]
MEQIKMFGIETKKLFLNLMNTCVSTLQIPKIWCKAEVVALPKPGKEPTDPKNFRSVSLLCHLYNVLERMITNRISESFDQKLIKEQSGFRPERSRCGQILNLTQHIEDGFERGQVTGVAFIYLSPVYGTVNPKRLTSKFYNITRDYNLTQCTQCLLQNIRYFVTLHSNKSRWRNQKNGLPQGSVLVPMLYNIYTNDQPIATASQGKTFEEVERKLTIALKDLSKYYDKNHLKSNTGKTQVCAFHLRNKDSKRKLNITWRGQQLSHCDTTKYLGVKLDLTLTFKAHCENTKL